MPAVGNFLNPSIVKIQMLHDEQVLATATGFFVKDEGQWFLITNWHVLAGCHPQTGLPFDSSSARPNYCRFHSIFLEESGVRLRGFTYRLDMETQGGSAWLQHPQEGQQIDIAALPVAPETVGCAKDIADLTGNDPEMWIDLGEDLFLPGFPLGLSANGMFAIWKRASLASSLEFGEGITRAFLVDTVTRQGMSGAPCLAIVKGPY